MLLLLLHSPITRVGLKGGRGVELVTQTTHPSKSRRLSGPGAKRPGFEALTDLLGSLNIISFLIWESGEDNRTRLFTETI